MSDLNFQDFSTVQSDKQPTPKTIASAATVTPTGFLSKISGTAAIVNISPPVSGAHMLVFIPLAAFTFTTAGNIMTAGTAVINSPMLLFYDPITAKYFVGEIIAA